MLNDAAQKKVIARLRRAIGQVEGISRMVEEGRYCVDVLLQLGAAQAALGQVSKLVLGSHVETCVREAMATGRPADRQRKVDELMEIFGRYGATGVRSSP